MARLRHLAIVTSNRERLVRFYRDAFGLRVTYGRPGRTYLSDGEFSLAIVDKEEDLREGPYIIGFDVPDIKDLAGTLTNAGASGSPEPMPEEHDAEYRVRDPDGNLLDLSIHGWPVV